MKSSISLVTAILCFVGIQSISAQSTDSNIQDDNLHATRTITATGNVSDTSGYLTQRLKVNSLLAERSAKFGQYELSLNARTGIFGLQTKQDLKNSNEILREIILNDNHVFRELKILMNYKDLQVQQVQNTATSTSKRIEGYMNTIKNLQQQNERLQNTAQKNEGENDMRTYVIILLGAIIIGGSVFFYAKLNKLKNSKL